MKIQTQNKTKKLLDNCLKGQNIFEISKLKDLQIVKQKQKKYQNYLHSPNIFIVRAPFKNSNQDIYYSAIYRKKNKKKFKLSYKNITINIFSNSNCVKFKNFENLTLAQKLKLMKGEQNLDLLKQLRNEILTQQLYRVA
eukprot:TRINITY_DN3249_c0_g1_i9.p2 TRINITY_DN3249_c0_g1~~TRINITY_DN3249_c0_g1_i9.p2  ORF type:complete len:139 (+),score=7.32 TRINITY_DN3249_c0_g1_i9:248-664(+)